MLSVIVQNIITICVECHNAECHDLFIVVLNVVWLNAIMLSVVMLSVLKPNRPAYPISST
jgi:hypothetical protein